MRSHDVYICPCLSDEFGHAEACELVRAMRKEQTTDYRLVRVEVLADAFDRMVVYHSRAGSDRWLAAWMGGVTDPVCGCDRPLPLEGPSLN